jgi:hypothetical protein
LPGSETDAVLRLIQEVYPGMEGATSVMQTSLQKANPMLHPAVMPANAVPGFGWATDTHRYKCRGHNPLRRPGAAVRLVTLFCECPPWNSLSSTLMARF